MAEFRGPRFRDTVTITVPLPAHEAMQMFTARGEREWADGWEPHFPTGEPAEEGEGTIFMTTAHDRPTYWVVAARTGKSVRYARSPRRHRRSPGASIGPGPNGGRHHVRPVGAHHRRCYCPGSSRRPLRRGDGRPATRHRDRAGQTSHRGLTPSCYRMIRLTMWLTIRSKRCRTLFGAASSSASPQDPRRWARPPAASGCPSPPSPST